MHPLFAAFIIHFVPPLILKFPQSLVVESIHYEY